MSDDEDNTPPESLFFMQRAEFVPKVSAEEFKSVSALLNKNDGSKNKLAKKEGQSSSVPAKKSRTTRSTSKEISVEPEESLEDIADSLDSHQVVLSAAAKRRLKKQQQERASELRLIKAANKQALAAVEATSLDDTEEIFVDRSENKISTILTISYLSGIARLRCYDNEKFAAIFPRVADKFKLKASEILLCLREQNIKVDDTPKSLNITLADTIECIPYKADENIEVNTDDKIRVFFQSSDSKEKIDLLVHKLQNMQEIMEKYSNLRDIPLEQLIFEFDGDQIEGTETPEDLDMESENCIDVRIVAPDSKKKNTRKRTRAKKETIVEIDDDSRDSDVLVCDDDSRNSDVLECDDDSRNSDVLECDDDDSRNSDVLLCD